MGQQSRQINKQYYADVTDHWVQKLQSFRQKYQQTTMTIGQTTWHYYDSGAVPDTMTLLLLPGGGGDSEIYFRYIEGFAHNFRVIAPDIPPTIQTVDDAVTGLQTLLAGLGVTTISLIGMTWGGQLAQIFVRRYPDSVQSAIFAQTTIPNDRDAERVRMQRQLIRLYPSGILNAMNKRQLQRTIASAPMPIHEQERAFWQAYYAEMYSTRWTKRDILARATLSIDFHANHQFDARDALHLAKDVLIIEATADEVVEEGERGSLGAMYPSAYLQSMEGYTHLAPVLCAKPYLRSMTHFLLKDDYEAYKDI